MKVTRLRGDGFRNLRELDFNPDEEVSVICGDNAQGKTNLLEAVWLFCGARSFRGAKDADHVAFGSAVARLELDFLAQGRPQSASIRMGQEQKRVLLNGIKTERVSELSGVFCAVVFSPDHLELVKQGPLHRRRLIDSSLCQAYPKYGKVLESYDKILKQRAVLLRDAQLHPQVTDLLEAWDESLIEYGGYITWMRARYVEKLAIYAKEAYEGISGGREKLTANYAAGCGEIEAGLGRKEITLMLSQAVKKSRGEDIRLGRTEIGPHRDDMRIMVGDKSARSFGSQGQQRSCVLAIKLAECRILEDGAGEPPVVLLDDVMSELDEGRRNYLLNNLSGRQVIITCCDPAAFGALVSGRVFRMSKGVLFS